MSINQMVSVVVPCFNKGSLVEQTVKSIFRSTYEHIEIIIINDGSTDPETILSLSKIKKMSGQKLITVLNTKNQGVAEARNLGVKKSSGEYVVFLDNDDMLDKYFIERGVAALNENQHIDYAYPEVIFFGEELSYRPARKFNVNDLFFRNYIPISCIFRRAKIADVLFSSELEILEDWDFFIRLTKKGLMGMGMHNIYLFYRISKSSRNGIRESYITRRKKITEVLKRNKIKHSLALKIKYGIIEFIAIFYERIKSLWFSIKMKHKILHDDYLKSEMKSLYINLH